MQMIHMRVPVLTHILMNQQNVKISAWPTFKPGTDITMILIEPGSHLVFFQGREPRTRLWHQHQICKKVLALSMPNGQEFAKKD